MIMPDSSLSFLPPCLRPIARISIILAIICRKALRCSFQVHIRSLCDSRSLFQLLPNSSSPRGRLKCLFEKVGASHDRSQTKGMMSMEERTEHGGSQTKDSTGEQGRHEARPLR